MAAVMSVDKNLMQQLRALGATKMQASWASDKRGPGGRIGVSHRGFWRIISEVGAVMLVGGILKAKQGSLLPP